VPDIFIEFNQAPLLKRPDRFIDQDGSHPFPQTTRAIIAKLVKVFKNLGERLNDDIFRIVMITQIPHRDQVEIIVMLVEEEFLCMAIVVVASVNKFLFVKYQFFHSLSYSITEPTQVTKGCLGKEKSLDR